MNEVPPVLVDTADVITYILGGSATKGERRLTRYRVYGAAQRGQLTRYGGTKRGTARWDLREVEALLHRYDKPLTLQSCGTVMPNYQ